MDALDQLWVAWQPIVDVAAGTVLGYEALIRGPADGPLAMSAALFAWAEAAGRAADLDAACKHLAYETAQGRWADPAQRLFLNVDTRWASLPDPWEQGRPGQIPLAVEVSEARSVLEDDVLLDAVARWRRAGHLVVIDDYGTGYAGPGEVLALQPDIIKLDRILIAGIDHDVQKQSLVRAIRGWTDDMGIGLLAEGVETAEEWASVRRLGCDYAQGFYLGRPEAARLPPVAPLRVAVPTRPRRPAAVRPAIHPVLAWYARADGMRQTLEVWVTPLVDGASGRVVGGAVSAGAGGGPGPCRGIRCRPRGLAPEATPRGYGRVGTVTRSPSVASGPTAGSTPSPKGHRSTGLQGRPGTG